jgi:hypothetical protein
MGAVLQRQRPGVQEVHSHFFDFAGRLISSLGVVTGCQVTLLQFCRASEGGKRENLKWSPEGDWLALGKSPMLVQPRQAVSLSLTRLNQHGKQ